MKINNEEHSLPFSLTHKTRLDPSSRFMKRRKKYPKRKARVIINSKTSILHRPEHINKRLKIGHWESDSVESKCRKKY